MKILAAGLAVAAGIPVPPHRAVADAPRASPTAPPLTAFSDEEFATALLAETNRVRRAHGRRPFFRRGELEGAAADQAGFMALTGRVQHASAIRGQGTLAERVRRRGLTPRMVAENVAAYPVRPDEPLETPAAVAAVLVAQWMDSPPHRANLLSRDFTHFGAAIRFAPKMRTVWAAYAVQVFSAG